MEVNENCQPSIFNPQQKFDELVPAIFPLNFTGEKRFCFIDEQGKPFLFNSKGIPTYDRIEYNSDNLYNFQEALKKSRGTCPVGVIFKDNHIEDIRELKKKIKKINELELPSLSLNEVERKILFLIQGKGQTNEKCMYADIKNEYENIIDKGSVDDELCLRTDILLTLFEYINILERDPKFDINLKRDQYSYSINKDGISQLSRMLKEDILSKNGFSDAVNAIKYPQELFTDGTKDYLLRLALEGNLLGIPLNDYIYKCNEDNVYLRTINSLLYLEKCKIISFEIKKESECDVVLNDLFFSKSRSAVVSSPEETKTVLEMRDNEVISFEESVNSIGKTVEEIASPPVRFIRLPLEYKERLCGKKEERYDYKLLARDLSILLTLSYHANSEGVCFPGTKLIAQESGLSLNNVKPSNNLKAFVGIEYVNTKKYKKYKSYTLLKYPTWNFLVPDIISGGVFREMAPSEKVIYILFCSRSYNLEYFFTDNKSVCINIPEHNKAPRKEFETYPIKREQIRDFFFIPSRGGYFNNIENTSLMLKMSKQTFYTGLHRLEEKKLICVGMIEVENSIIGSLYGVAVPVSPIPPEAPQNGPNGPQKGAR